MPAKMRQWGGAVMAATPGRSGWLANGCRFACLGFGMSGGARFRCGPYEALHGDRAVNDVLLKRVLYGISCRNYEAAAAIPGAIGLSGSTISRSFIQASAAKLRELQERDLSQEDVEVLVLDGKTFASACCRCNTGTAALSCGCSRPPCGSCTAHT